MSRQSSSGYKMFCSECSFISNDSCEIIFFQSCRFGYIDKRMSCGDHCKGQTPESRWLVAAS